MRTRRILAVAVTAALVTPSLVLADGIGPHTNWYDQHPNSRKPQNDVTILFHRDKHDADLFVSNFCLGTEPGGPAGSPPFPNSASARGVGVKHGKISFDGKA